MDSGIHGMLPLGLKPTLRFGALDRPATHPLGGFTGRALLQSIGSFLVSQHIQKGILGGWAGITLLWILESEIRIERGGDILRKRAPAQVV